MNKVLSFIVTFAVVFAPVYSIASEINLNGQGNVSLSVVDNESSDEYTPQDGGYTETTSIFLPNTVAGLFERPGESGEGIILSSGIGIAASDISGVNYDTEENAEEKIGTSTTTWIIIGVLAAVATLVVLGVLLSSEGGCGG